MGGVTDKIRTHIGEGELSDAIEALTGYLKTVGGDIYNQAILLKGKYKDYHREKMMGMTDNEKVKSQISMAVLDLATQIDKEDLASPAANTRTPASDNPTFKKPASLDDPPRVKYAAQCFFTGDMMQYYITQNDQIVAVNPMNNQSLIIGVKMPSQDANYAWTYYVNATGVY